MTNKPLHVLTEKIIKVPFEKRWLIPREGSYTLHYDEKHLNIIILEEMERIYKALAVDYLFDGEKPIEGGIDPERFKEIREILNLPQQKSLNLEEELIKEIQKISPWINKSRGPYTTDGSDLYPNYQGIAKAALDFARENKKRL